MTTQDNAVQQAKAQLQSIRDMMERLRNATDDDERTVIEEEISNDPLEVTVRSDWTQPGYVMEPDEFCLLLCTGGPAVRIIGDLDKNCCVFGQPRIEYQDWFTPWTNYPLSDDEAQDVYEYACMFFPC